MVDATKDLDEEKLQENFKYWVAQLSEASSLSEGPIPECALPTAHTFGFYREFFGTKRNIYEDILLIDKALLSDKYRKQNKKLLPREYRARVRMTRARRVKLHHFVFSYFGIHDPYYTRGGEYAIPGFGVFIKTNIEAFPNCNATRRDISSPEVKPPFIREFLLPSDAKLLAYLQALNDARHSNDFWHYWGKPQYFSNPGYATRHWEWNIELHFRDKVPVSDFAAILWPFELQAVGAGRLERRMLGDYETFQSIFPNCKVIPYNWKQYGQSSSLIIASYSVARFYLANNRFPDEAEDAF
jgi:hypothetical protein